MGKRLALVGGGHAHMTVMLRLAEYVERGHQVTLVSPSPYHYYSGMGPGMLGGFYRPQQVRFHIRKLVEKRGGVFVEDRVTRVLAPEHRLELASGRHLEYDVASFNTGSGVPMERVGALGDDAVPVKPIHNLSRIRRWILDQMRIRSLDLLVVGGGPAGVELAGNLWRLVRQAGGEARITLVAGRHLLNGFPEKARRMAMMSLSRREIRVIEGARAVEVSRGLAHLDDGSEIPYDRALVAVGVEPGSLFRESGLPVGEDGGLLVNDRLQSVSWPELFGGGDCISFQDRSLQKVGVYAVRQNPILFHNLLAALEGRNLTTFEPQKHFMLIFNLGDGKGLFIKNRWVWQGRLAFTLKDWIDRRFMGRFQRVGELTEADRN
ncbi:MAG: FAD-dependent oxidoreductase [Syntrophotaleaceae bacterium]